MSEISDLNHECFLDHLKESEPARWRIARWLVGLGYNVAVKPMRAAPTVEEWRKFADNGDLDVIMRVEVKQLTCDFTSREDWPFGDKFIVCSRRSFDEAQPRPYCYIILNNAGTHAAFVLGDSYKTWKVETRTDSRYPRYQQEFYFAPLNKVTFRSIESEVSTNES